MLIYNLLSMQQYGKLQESYSFLTSTSRHKNCNCDSHISVRGVENIFYLDRRELNRYSVDCDKPPKHILEPTVISSPHSQEFMVSRISSVVLILLEPLMDEFTLMKVF